MDLSIFGLFPILIVIRNAAIKKCGPISLQYMSRSGIAGSQVDFVFKILRTAELLPKVAAQFYISTIDVSVHP
jgi:hypothetical protein